MNSKYHKRISNQSKNYSQTLYLLINGVMTEGKPADVELRVFFRKHKQFGSNDRRFISETLFSFFRWWGWLRRIPVSVEKLWKKKSEIMALNPTWLTLLVSANLLDSKIKHAVVKHWQQHIGGTVAFPTQMVSLAELPLFEKAKYFSKWFTVPKLTLQELMPDWAGGKIFHKGNIGTELLSYMQKRPPLWIRSQTHKISTLKKEFDHYQLAFRQSKLINNAFSIHSPKVNLYEIPAFKKGKFEVQDLASQVIGIMTKAKPGERWWDVCAGAGGKSLQLATLMNNKGTVLATDIRPGKLKDLRKRAKRAHFSNITPKNWNGTKIPCRSANFDGVLVDAPCSGTGTWRRNPDARWNFQPPMLRSFADVQLNILITASRAVKPGGFLVYATCSMCKCENEDVINQFLQQAHNFSLIPSLHPLTKKKTNGMIYVWPHIADTDVVFVARLQKSNTRA